ncbi:cupin domain-containing protein [Paraburkholderia sp. BR14374]|uniref:cupin domain-containing protein n=1 Tax=Paraburkholderia sp. BR14374 TaxID=3237007 RepID=UPI0034CECE86
MNHHVRESGSGRQRSAPGSSSIHQNRNEIFHVLEGTFSLESETTPQTEFTKGDTGVIPAGFCGTLRVTEAVRKIYVLLT